MASITRSAHSPNVEPPDGLLASFGLIPSASPRASLCSQLARAGESHITRRSLTRFLSVYRASETEIPTVGHRSSEIDR